MVKRCVNPTCRAEFNLLNAGDLYVYGRQSADTEFGSGSFSKMTHYPELFWLCCSCASELELHLDSEGTVSVRERSARRRARSPHPDGNLRMVSHCVRPAPRPRTMPFGERSDSFSIGAGRISPGFGERGAIHR